MCCLQGLTALAFPPTCIDRSWNQDQVKSSSVDLDHTELDISYDGKYIHVQVKTKFYIYLIKDRCTPRDL